MCLSARCTRCSLLAVVSRRTLSSRYRVVRTVHIYPHIHTQYRNMLLDTTLATWGLHAVYDSTVDKRLARTEINI